MLRLKRTNANDAAFVKLVKDLDKFLAVTDGEDHAFYNQFNKLDNIKYAIIVYFNDQPIGCGAIKKYDEVTFEIKRMYIEDSFRGNGYAGEVIQNLESWAKELGATKCILETGIRQAAAIKLYQKNGYYQIDNYGQYHGVDGSLCFCKII